jgi:hypothetical protein
VALTAFCTTCQRTVYIEADDTPVCPVCSTPLLETVEERPERREQSDVPAPARGLTPEE